MASLLNQAGCADEGLSSLQTFRQRVTVTGHPLHKGSKRFWGNAGVRYFAQS